MTIEIKVQKVRTDLSDVLLIWWHGKREFICDGCGEQFATTLDEDDDPMPLDEDAEEFEWTVYEDAAYCGNCQHLDPDQPGVRMTLTNWKVRGGGLNNAIKPDVPMPIS